MLGAALFPRSLAATATGIEWCDFTANKWTGCTEIPASAGAKSGCVICYARTFSERKWPVEWGAHQPRYLFAGWRNRVRRLEAAAIASGRRFSVFSLSLGDWLDPEVDPSWRAELIEAIDESSHLDWLLLTHRPHLIRKLAPESWRSSLPGHVWPGVTLDHKLHARRWHELAEVWGGTSRAWVSAEPLLSSLEDIDLDGAACIIVGGASNTRDSDYALDLAAVDDLARRYEDRLFFKQHGNFLDGQYVGKKKAGRELAGRTFGYTPWALNKEWLRTAAASPDAEQAFRGGRND